MATPRKVGGYIFRQELARAIRANRSARLALGRILEEPGPRLTALYLAQAARELAENFDALMEMRQILDEKGENGE